MKTVQLTLQQQITILVGVLCLAVVLGTAGGAAWIGHRQATVLVNADIVELARNMAARLDRVMFERYREIRSIATFETLRDFASAPGKIRDVLQHRQGFVPDYAWMGFADANGTVKVATGGLLEGTSVAERPWFQDGLKGPALGNVHDAKLLAAALGPARDAAPFRFVDVAAPVFDASGAVIGVFGAHLSWSWASDLRRQLLSLNSLGEDTELWILSSEGEILLGPKFHDHPFAPQRVRAIVKDGHGAFEDNGPSGSMLTGFAATSGYRDYPGLGWIVIARRSSAVAFAGAREMVVGIGLLGLLVASVGAMLAWVLARRVAQPLRRLTMAADRIGRDPARTMLPRVGGSLEAVHLSAALRALLRRIGNAEQQLVDQRQHSTEAVRGFEDQLRVLRHVADTDHLSGLLNRRAFLVSAQDAFAYHHRYGRPVGLLMVDIDHFKRVNDSFGHAVGDTVIRYVGDVLTSMVRTSDKVARFGGEEYVVLLREVDETSLHLLAERMREAIKAMVVTEGEASLGVTVSIGAAVIAATDQDVQDLIRRADEALYRAKHAGRNCTRAARIPTQIGRAA